MLGEDSMFTDIDYPRQTSEWGRSLIDVLNINLSKIIGRIERVNDNIDEKFSLFKKDINSIKTTADSALNLAEQNKKDIDLIRDEINYLKFTCGNLVEENNMLKQHTNNLENYSRRNNIVVRGIAEQKGESKSDCELKARHFLKNNLNIDENTVKDMKFVRCHRIGRFDPRKQNRFVQQKRPLIIRFCNYSDKSLVWNARNQIKDDHIFMSENFSFDTEYRRKKLYAIYKKAKTVEKYKMKCSMSGDVLILDSVRYTVNDLLDLPEELKPRQFSERSNDEYLVFGGIQPI